MILNKTWKKLGKIFDPVHHQLLDGGAGFAQSPQVLVLEDRVRIYFSTRKKDNIGKFLSYVFFVDFDKSFRKIIAVSKNPVIELGELGCFDEHGIFPMNVLQDGDRVIAYTTGWNRKISVSADAAIGLAVSHDGGLTFVKHGLGPVMSASLHEPFLIGDAFVAKYNNIFHMWYIFGVRWVNSLESEFPDRVYKIAHAVSNDGLDWSRDSRLIISDSIGEDECQALPTVIEVDGIYHMYFCYRAAHGFRESAEKSYRIGYAYSVDLINWVRDDSLVGIDVSPAGWDSEMQCYPHVFKCDNNIYMLYNGNEFGRYGFGLAVLN